MHHQQYRRRRRGDSLQQGQSKLTVTRTTTGSTRAATTRATTAGTPSPPPSSRRAAETAVPTPSPPTTRPTTSTPSALRSGTRAAPATSARRTRLRAASTKVLMSKRHGLGCMDDESSPTDPVTLVCRLEEHGAWKSERRFSGCRAGRWTALGAVHTGYTNIHRADRAVYTKYGILCGPSKFAAVTYILWCPVNRLGAR